MTSRKTRILITLIAATLSVAAWTTGAAAADRIAVDTRAILSQATPFHVRLVSKKAACERGRTVDVYRVEQGSDGLYGSTTSDSRGKWSVPASMPNGKFYAVARQRSIDAPGKTLVCRKAISPKVAF